MEIADQLLAGDTRALARAISLVERDDPKLPELLSELQPHTGHSYLLGFTGPPGGGKSTLVDAVIEVLRRQDKTVGVLAVDPNSPFTGGAVLGDRVRMQRHALDPGVFVRSMGARGHLGGLAGSSRQAAKVLDAFGRDFVLMETVGVGQSELEVSSLCDTTIVVVNPRQGDEIQAIKAGILEIADIFAVNKADLPGSDSAVRQLQQTYPDDMKEGDWLPPIIKTVATRGEGVDELIGAVERHRQYVIDSGQLEQKRRRHLRDEVLDFVAERARRKAERRLGGSTEIGRRLAEAPLRELDPYSIAGDIMNSDG
ncbi:MAG TPA: methylmalonyl Co-A mutase-associated GTPase MeaB [Candidatus Solibacter sp.]|jgi:LAO/AO transport system kinase|nr:methylmalonyl Co-A mutase-associated GTPase MeaB [Candidatus Solibacter sp.]